MSIIERAEWFDVLSDVEAMLYNGASTEDIVAFLDQVEEEYIERNFVEIEGEGDLL